MILITDLIEEGYKKFNLIDGFLFKNIYIYIYIYI